MLFQYLSLNFLALVNIGKKRYNFSDNFSAHRICTREWVDYSWSLNPDENIILYRADKLIKICLGRGDTIVKGVGERYRGSMRRQSFDLAARF